MEMMNGLNYLYGQKSWQHDKFKWMESVCQTAAWRMKSFDTELVYLLTFASNIVMSFVAFFMKPWINVNFNFQLTALPHQIAQSPLANR